MGLYIQGPLLDCTTLRKPLQFCNSIFLSLAILLHPQGLSRFTYYYYIYAFIYDVEPFPPLICVCTYMSICIEYKYNAKHHHPCSAGNVRSWGIRRGNLEPHLRPHSGTGRAASCLTLTHPGKLAAHASAKHGSNKTGQASNKVKCTNDSENKIEGTLHMDLDLVCLMKGVVDVDSFVILLLAEYTFDIVSHAD